jgi:hypothetical protein
MGFVSTKAPAESSITDPPTVLIASTSWWPFTARIALRFAALGWRVEAICPAGHPLRFTQAVARCHPYAALRPLSALAAAVDAARPTLLVPCDERVREHLHALHALTPPGAPLSELIVRSLGQPDGFAPLLRRVEMIRLAIAAGVRAAPMWPVASASDLRAALAEVGFPAMLKVDGTWGGAGVMPVHGAAEAERARVLLGRRLAASRALKRLLVDRDPFPLLPWLDGTAPRVGVQRHVAGRPANSLVACWQGEVLASIEVEVLRTSVPLGASTVVRVIDHAEMAETAAVLVRRLGLSGFCGFDFMLEDGTGAAHLIEVNPRSTPLSHLALGPGRDPVAALAARLTGRGAAASAPVTDNPVIVHFPQAWRQDPASELLRTGHHDVPWEDPGLLRELMRAPYPKRGLLARLIERAGPRLGTGLSMPEHRFGAPASTASGEGGVAA